MKKVLLAAVGLLLVVWFMRPPRSGVPVQVSRLALGSVVVVKVYGDEQRVRPLIDLAFAEIDRIDALMSRHRETSEANQLERLAADSAVTCSPELAQVLERSQYFARLSGGAFDVTIGALTRLWNFPEVAAPPAPARIDSARALVGYEDLQVEGRQVRLRRSGLRLDLGGAAAGFAVDRAVELLQAQGVAAGLIDASGDIRFWGQKPDGQPWRIGIQHPRQADGVLIAELEDIGLPAVATSGDYEQFFEWEGRRFHHILDPATGYPAERAISATVWAATAMDADILSTTVFVLGPERGIALVESLPRVEALVLFQEEGHLRYRTSRGIESRFRFLEVKN